MEFISVGYDMTFFVWVVQGWSANQTISYHFVQTRQALHSRTCKIVQMQSLNSTCMLRLVLIQFCLMDANWDLTFTVRPDIFLSKGNILHGSQNIPWAFLAVWYHNDLWLLNLLKWNDSVSTFIYVPNSRTLMFD